MKGKSVFTVDEITELRSLISARQGKSKSDQKKIRDRMREIGFYGGDDWGIKNCQVCDLERLIKNGLIMVDGDKRIYRATSDMLQNKTAVATKESGRKGSDEYYVIGLCDEALGCVARRQYRFDFLIGDTGVRLPVDAYYEKLRLVVEYCESQHTCDTPFFDNKQTASGISRGEQRRKYDQRRRTEIPKHGIRFIEIHYSDFGTSKRLKRNYEHDIAIVKAKLSKFLK